MSKVFLLLILTTSVLFSQESNWEHLEIPFYGGSVISLAIKSENEIYIGTLTNGIFYSNNMGESWSRLEYFVDRSVYFNPGDFVDPPVSIELNNNSVIFAGGGESAYKSDDNGATWTKIFSTHYSINIRAIEVDNEGIIYIGTNGGIHRSDNGGNDWVNITDGLIYRAVNGLATNSSNDILVINSDGVFRSINMGADWIKVGNFEGGNTIIVNPADEIFAGTQSSVYRSGDNGDTWVKLDDGLPPNYINDICTFEDSTVFLATNSGVYYSENNGNIWEVYNSGLSNEHLRSRAIGVFPSGRVILGLLDEAIYIRDFGVTLWQQSIQGISRYVIQALLVLPNDYVFVGTDDGLFRFTDNGENWEILNEMKTLSLANSGDSVIYIGTDSSIYSSKDLGKTLSDLSPNNSFSFVTAIVVNTKEYIYALKYGLDYPGIYGPSGIYRSMDSGLTWEIIKHHFDAPPILVLNSLDHLYIGSVRYNYLLRSTDEGNSFIRFGDWWVTKSITRSIEFLPDEKLIISFSAPPLSGGYNGVFITDDYLVTWDTVTTDLGGIFIANKILTLNNTLYYATTNGIKSTDIDGQNWDSHGLDGKDVTKLVVDSEGRFFAAVEGEGLYSRDMIVGVKEAEFSPPHEFSLTQNYPNPFNPTTTIKYQIPQSAFVNLSVFNILGEKIVTLINKVQTAGEYKIDFNASSLPSGVYLYRIQAEQYSETKKMVLLR